MSSGDQGRFPAVSERVMAVSCPWLSRPPWPLWLSTPSPTLQLLPSHPPSSCLRRIQVNIWCERLPGFLYLGEARQPALCPGEPHSTTRETEARGQVGGGC